jgi:hypothetical protein
MPDKRKDAMLTDFQRRFLAGEHTYTGEHAAQERYQRRTAIRGRIRNSLRDFTFLFDHLDSDELLRLFDPNEYDADEWNAIYAGMIDALALFFRANFERADHRDIQYPSVMNDDLVKAALRRALGARGEVLYDFTPFMYSTRQDTVSELQERFLSGEPLSHTEFETLASQGAIEDEKGRIIDPVNFANVRYGLADEETDDVPEDETDTDEED